MSSRNEISFSLKQEASLRSDAIQDEYALLRRRDKLFDVSVLPVRTLVNINYQFEQQFKF